MPPEPIKLVTQINRIQYTHEHFGLENITNVHSRLLADTTWLDLDYSKTKNIDAVHLNMIKSSMEWLRHILAIECNHCIALHRRWSINTCPSLNTSWCKCHSDYYVKEQIQFLSSNLGSMTWMELGVLLDQPRNTSNISRTRTAEQCYATWEQNHRNHGITLFCLHVNLTCSRYFLQVGRHHSNFSCLHIAVTRAVLLCALGMERRKAHVSFPCGDSIETRSRVSDMFFVPRSVLYLELQ